MAPYFGYSVKSFDPTTKKIGDDRLIEANLKTFGAEVIYDAVKQLPAGHQIALELDFDERPDPVQLEIISRCLARNRITPNGEPTIIEAKDGAWEVYYTGIQRNEIVRIPKALEEINNEMRPYDRPR